MVMVILEWGPGKGTANILGKVDAEDNVGYGGCGARPYRVCPTVAAAALMLVSASVSAFALPMLPSVISVSDSVSLAEAR
jgi:hypothetical protein